MTDTLQDAPLGVCACGQPNEGAYQRHLAQAEYDALPDELKPIDGYAVTAVHACGDCLPDPICAHPDEGPVPCPVCHAEPGAQCTKPDGSPRPVGHRERAAAQPRPDTCTHAHREDCTSPDACQCSGDDQPPARLPRVILPPTQQQILTDLGVAPAMLARAVELIAQRGIDPTRVRGGFRTGLTQDNRPAILFDYAVGTDAHGREQTETRIEPIEVP
jgi:hypothetical protein